jgi:hypothetical protein
VSAGTRAGPNFGVTSHDLLDVSTETERPAPLARFTAAADARSSVDTWAEGAAMMSLLTTIRSRGWLEFLAAGLTLPELTAFAGLSPDRVSAIVDVLGTHGVTADPVHADPFDAGDRP